MADGEWLREVEYVQHVADTAKAGQPQIGAIVGSAPVAEGAVNTTYWVSRMMAASPLFRGIRRGLPSPTPNSTSCDYLMGPFLDGVRVLGDHGMWSFTLSEHRARAGPIHCRVGSSEINRRSSWASHRIHSQPHNVNSPLNNKACSFASRVADCLSPFKLQACTLSCCSSQTRSA